MDKYKYSVTKARVNENTGTVKNSFIVLLSTKAIIIFRWFSFLNKKKTNKMFMLLMATQIKTNAKAMLKMDQIMKSKAILMEKIRRSRNKK